MLKDSEVAVLACLKKVRRKSVPIENVAEVTGLKKKSAYYIVSYMVHNGFIACSVEESSGRGRPKCSYSITEDGISVLADFEEFRRLKSRAKELFSRRNILRKPSATSKADSVLL